MYEEVCIKFSRLFIEPKLFFSHFRYKNNKTRKFQFSIPICIAYFKKYFENYIIRIKWWCKNPEEMSCAKDYFFRVVVKIKIRICRKPYTINYSENYREIQKITSSKYISNIFLSFSFRWWTGHYFCSKLCINI